MSGHATHFQCQASRAQRAAAAWSALWPSCPGCTSIETLQEKKNSAVYRLAHARPDGQNIIAKWLRAEPCATERTVYDDILARLENRAARCFGSIADGTEGFQWIFVEEASGVEYDVTDPAHRAIASKWLAELHSTAYELAAAAAESGRLPLIGLWQCAMRISRATDRITRFIGNPELSDEDRSVLAEVVGQCELLSGSCDRLDRQYWRFAPTLVHGDFVAKNLRICNENGRSRLLVFDWEMAGYGPPAADLAECADLETYHASLRGNLPPLKLPDLKLLALIGKALRWAAAVDWASWGLEGSWVRKPMRNLRCYCNDMRELACCLRQAGLVA